MLLGARLAADEINAAGGVGDHAVELVALGVDVASIDSIRSGLHRLTSMNVDAVAFGYAETRDSVRSLLDDWGDAGMPLLHSLTSHEADEIVATGHGRYSNVFQVCPSDNFYGDQFLRFLSRALPGDAGREIVMVSDDPQMIGYHPLWADKAARAGYRMWLRELVVEGDAEHAAAEIVEQDPVAVFLACFRSSALKRFMRRFLSGPSRSLVYALWAPGTSDFRQELHSVEGLVWSTSTGKYSDQIGKGFEARFASRFGRGVFGTSASIQYDSISLLAHAWRRAGRTSSYTRTMDELRALVHRGVNGSYFFGSDLQRSLAYGLESRDASLSQAHLTYQVQDGMNRIIGPRPYAETRYLPQPWLAAGPRSRMPES